MRALVHSVAAAALIVSACSGCTKEQGVPFRLRSAVPEGRTALEVAVYQTTGSRLTAGNSVEWADDARVFDAAVEAIRGARRSVHVVLYIWRPGKASDRVLQVLSERARAGVACRVLVDPVGSKAFEEKVKPQLEAAGCQARFFRPLPADENLARNHRKLVIVDGELGITGGFGIHDAWLPRDQGGDGWRDANAIARGAVVAQMQRAFAQNWQEMTGELLPADDFPCLVQEGACRDGEVEAAFVSSTANPEVTDAERITQLLVRAAQKRLWISQAYFTPNDVLKEMLIERARAGVDVRVLAPGSENDQPAITVAQRATYPELTSAGVRIWEYRDVMMHAKTMLVDEDVVLVGSINYDPFSFNVLEEGSLLVRDRAFAKALEEAFERDVGRADPVKAARK